MKRLNQIIKIIQFTLAVFLIVSIGWYAIQLINDLFNIQITAMNVFIFSFVGFIILGITSFFLKEKH